MIPACAHSPVSLAVVCEGGARSLQRGTYLDDEGDDGVRGTVDRGIGTLEDAALAGRARLAHGGGRGGGLGPCGVGRRGRRDTRSGWGGMERRT